MPANSLFNLTVGRSFLSQMPPLDASETGAGALTEADVARAELMALREVQSLLYEFYDVSAWEGAGVTPPPLVGQVGELLGSAVLWSMRNVADGGFGMSGAPEGMRQHALSIIDSIRSGKAILLDAAGAVVQRLQKVGLADIETT